MRNWSSPRSVVPYEEGVVVELDDGGGGLSAVGGES